MASALDCFAGAVIRLPRLGGTGPLALLPLGRQEEPVQATESLERPPILSYDFIGLWWIRKGWSPHFSERLPCLALPSTLARVGSWMLQRPEFLIGVPKQVTGDSVRCPNKCPNKCPNACPNKCPSGRPNRCRNRCPNARPNRRPNKSKRVPKRVPKRLPGCPHVPQQIPSPNSVPEQVPNAVPKNKSPNRCSGAQAGAQQMPNRCPNGRLN